MERQHRPTYSDLGSDLEKLTRPERRLVPSSDLRYNSHAADTPSPARDTHRQADYRIDFLIVGGGIAGLAAAYALAASGHRVRVLEREASVSNRPGGVRLPPNLTRILTYWGLEEELAQKATITTSSSILDMKTGHPIARSAWKTELITETGSTYLMMHHADLHDVLHRLALSAGARVTFGAAVASITPAPEEPSPEEGGQAGTSAPGPGAAARPRVELVSGEVLEADVIIGADGPYSIARRAVLGDDDGPAGAAPPTGVSVYTGSVPMAEVRAHEPLRRLVQESWPIWLGDGRSVLAYPVRRHEELAIHVWWQDARGAAPGSPASWEPTASLRALRYGDAQMDPRLRFLLDKAGPVSRQPYVEYERPETWVDDAQSIVLIGEAAHPQCAGTTYGCSLAIEDAAALGALFARLPNAAHVPVLLSAFQDLRRPRADALTALEAANARVARAAPARVRDGLVRFAALVPGVDPEPAELTDDELADVASVWAYDAVDAADGWWVEWGLLRKHADLKR
ncbi:hypothetical protein BC834DRAFT_843152 [Gloeopeniophorella convolvens]|nr:hypothetical protein BC834DRAFT_843152 [Gloeopeniophorella convolvens]